MKFACGKSKDEKEAAKKEWHTWFAWYPVKVGSYDCRWLEAVERRFYDHNNRYVKHRALV